MSDSTEQALFLQAKTGNRAAFDRLQARLEAPLRRFIFRLIGQTEAEDDILRTTLLALYMNLERIEPAENLRPFLFRVVRNLCYKELRRQGRFRVVSLETGFEDAETPPIALSDSRPTPEEQAHWALLYGEVQKAMERLPELQRQTMILYCEENLSYAQIATAMTADIGTVKSRLFYARKNLMRMLPPGVAAALTPSQ